MAEFAEKLANSKRPVASVIMGRETPTVAQFKLEGAQRVLQEVRAGCGRDDLIDNSGFLRAQP